MEPMKPMKPMEPMKPMKPMDSGPAWWPSDLGSPSTSGSQNGMRYAAFPDKHRLVVDKGGKITTYDTGDNTISGVSQQDSGSQSVTFTSQKGTVDLDDLKQV